MTKRIACLIAGLSLVGTTVLLASEKKVQLKDLPPAVRAAVQAHTEGAAIKAVIEESNNGKTSYEVETTRAGKTRDLLFDAAGTLIEVEQEIGLDEAPAGVKTALLTHGKVIKLESLTKGTVVTYEAEVEKNGKRTEVEVGADGKTIKH